MPIVTTNFIRGRMNKSVDERLLPPGEYVDAMNLRLGSTETTEIGAVENSKGNTQLTTLEYINIPLSSTAKCIGAYEDSAEETIYWFVHENDYDAKGAIVDMIVSFNTNTSALRYHVITRNTLNFDPKFLITGVEKIEDLLFFTDNLNPPRKINVRQTYPFPNGSTDLTLEEDLNVIVKPPGYEFTPGVGTYIPLPAPTLDGITLPGSENYIENRFLCFAYRYRYQNNEYSAISLFSKPAFATGQFRFSVKNYNNEGMQNRFNAVNISFSTGSSRVKEVDLLFKDTSTNNIYVIERFDKEENGWASDSIHTFQFNNSKIYSVLGSDELLRLYDNVPTKAQALTIMGNRLIYGNYVDGFNITNENGQEIALNYSTKLINRNVDFIDLPDATISNGVNYTIDPTTTVTATNAVAEFDLSDINTQLKNNSVLNFSITTEHSQLSGTTTESCYQDNVNFSNGVVTFDFSVTLTADYSSVYDFSQSSDFRNAIGTEEGVNFQPIATASDGGSLTDSFNNDLAIPSVTCTFTKTLSSINDSTAQQGWAITSTPGSDIIKLQVLAIKFVSAGSAGPPVVNQTDLYEYFRISTASLAFTSTKDTGSLHSNRDFATGIVYLDDYGRASTVLTSNFNTISIPASDSVRLNSIEATVENYAPSWAQRYKFVVKPSKGNYETIFSNFYYTVQTSQVTYFKLEGDNQNKVKTGDTLIVKTDVGGPITRVVKAKVLNVEAQARNFLDDEQGMGDETFQLPGLYMEIKPSGFNVNIPQDAIVENGEISDASTGDDGRCKTGVNYPLFTTDSAGVTENYTIPAGSAIQIKIRVSRDERGNKCEGFEWKWEQTLFASSEYPDFRRWWIGDQINPANASPGKIEADGNIEVINKTTVGSYSAGVGGVTCTTDSGQNVSSDSVFFQFLQDTVADPASPLGLVVKTKKPGCAGFQPFSRRRNVKVECEIVVTRANTMIVFETEPLDANADIFFDASESYPIIRDSATGNYLHQSGSADADQNQTTSQPAIVTLPFIDCFTFGNGVESFKINDDLAGRALTMGQRVLAVSEQDFKEANRFADVTYSGIFSSNAGVNNLNEFNLGLANFKELETSFGPIQKLYARETDILTLQEDKISYVLASKNLISDASGGGAIVSTPTILGTQIARIEEYGISFNPESFAHYGDSYYFTDTKRVGVIRLRGNSQNDQLTVISDLGMRSWFRDNFQTALDTQKIGGYDPYMDEYVLSTNNIKVPVPEVIYECGAEFQGSTETAQSYTVDFGAIIGDIDLDYSVTGSATFSITWNGNTVSTGVVSNNSGTLTINKSSNSPSTALVTVTPDGGNASFVITPKCVTPLNITVFKCVINSNIKSGSLIHVEYGWSDTSTISPIDTDQITMGSNDLIFSYFQSQTGVRSVGVYPYNGASLNMRVNKLATDDYDWTYPNDNFKFLSTNTLYQNNTTDVAALLAAASDIPNSFVTNPSGTNVREATVTPSTNPAFTLPTGNQYLYLIYDFRFTSAQSLCYSDTSASEACCECTIPCTSFSASTVQTSSSIACQQPLVETFYYTGGPAGITIGSLVYSDSQCAGNAPGQGINNLPQGYYKITGNEYIRVNSQGLVIEKTSC